MDSSWVLILTVGALVTAVVTIVVTVLTRYMQARTTRYDEVKRRIELEEMRSYLERKLYETTSKLTATESRWKDVNHLVLASQGASSDGPTSGRIDRERFLRDSGVSAEAKVDPTLVFVITPFHEKFDAAFDVVKKSCDEIGMRALRGDEDHVEGEIFPHILRLIVKARIIVANIEGRNPNVFYELGIAQALGKTVIVVSGFPEDAPFDLRTKRLVIYQNLSELRERLPGALARAMVFEGDRFDR